MTKETPVIPSDPRGAVHALPFLCDADPHHRLCILATDADGERVLTSHYPLHLRRPLDAPILDASLWPTDVVGAMAVLYADTPTINLQPLIDAWTHTGRAALQVVWAGPTRWRSLLCETGCCPPRGHRYAARVAGHDDFAPVQVPRDRGWRRLQWEQWMTAIAGVRTDSLPAPQDQQALAASLHDIPVRDALLAHSALDDGIHRPQMTALLRQLATRSTPGTGAPVLTALASMHYLANELDEAAEITHGVLAVEEYSLARLLANGLEMRAPASLLARSFTHWHPMDLLAERAA